MRSLQHKAIDASSDVRTFPMYEDEMKTTEADYATRTWFRVGATLVAIGEIVYIVAGSLHAGHGDPNDHAAVFADYAASASWTMVHLGQFVAFGAQQYERLNQ